MFRAKQDGDMRKLIHIVFGVLKSGTAFTSCIAVHSVVTSRPQ